MVFNYTKYFNIVDYIQPNIQHALVIGAGAYSYPKFFLKKFPEAQVDVVEMDAKLTELSRKHFGLQDDPRLHIFHQDGRTFLNQGTKKYDAIFIDAFNSLTPPFQLTTQEAVHKIFEQLSDTGVVLVNLVSAIEGKDGKFLQAEYATYASLFPKVEIFAVDNFNDPHDLDNVMLVAYKSNQTPDWTKVPTEYQKMAAHRWLAPIAAAPILTDEFAPVEQYLQSAYQR